MLKRRLRVLWASLIIVLGLAGVAHAQPRRAASRRGQSGSKKIVMARLIRYENTPMLRKISFRKWNVSAHAKANRRVRRKHSRIGTRVSVRMPP